MKPDPQSILGNDLNPEDLTVALRDSMFAGHITLMEKTRSTNTFAKETARRGGPEGVLIISEEQTGGRGRVGRKWFSPGGVNLYFSAQTIGTLERANLI